MIFKRHILSAVTALSMVCCMPISTGIVTLTIDSNAADSDIADEATGLSYTVDDGIVTITGCNNKSDTLTIPAEIDGMPVKAIGQSAFGRNTKIKTLIIEEGVEQILPFAFSSVMYLKSVKLPDSLKYIGEKAFYNCSKITEINIPSGIRTISQSAFEGIGVKEIVIPEGITEIGESAFSGCSDALAVYIPPTVSVIGKNAFHGCQMLQYIDLPFGVEYIGESAFSTCNGLKEIYLPESLQYIGDEAFAYIQSTKYTVELVLPDSLRHLGNGVFSHTTAIKSVNCPPNLEYVGFSPIPPDMEPEIVDGVQYFGNWVIGCDRSEGRDFKVREGTVGIAPNAFYGLYKKPSSIELPSTVRYICDNICPNKTDINSLTVSEDNPYICAVDDVLYSKDMTMLIRYPQWRTDETFTVPEGVVEIGERAFFECLPLTRVDLPDTVKYIDDSAFAWCKGMTEIVLPEGLLEIGDNAFGTLSSMPINYVLDIPDTVTRIGKDAFSGTNITKQRGGLLVIDDWVVGGYFVNETDIALDETIRGIADGALKSCKITGVTMDAVEYIGKDSFKNCIITSAEFSDSLISIDDGAFCDCRSLKKPTIPDSVIHVGEGAFDHCYKSIETADGIDYVDTWAVYGDRQLTSASLREGTTGVAESAFFTCFDLTEITLPDSLYCINSAAFEACISLENAELPDSLLLIDAAAFAYCTSLSEVALPESLIYVDYGAFYGCDGMEKITVYQPETAIYMSPDTFPEQAVIYGYTGSTAELYAEVFDREFVSIGEYIILMGDVNRDGEFNVADLVMMEKYLLGSGTLIDPRAGNFVADNVIDTYDLCLMRRAIVG